MVDWASRRAAALILELAGGTLERGVVVGGTLAWHRPRFRFGPERVGEVLGIDVPAARQQADPHGPRIRRPSRVRPAEPAWRAPTWRRDCWREIDLVEEIARIEGYDRVPEDVAIAARPVELSARERTTAARRARCSSAPASARR